MSISPSSAFYEMAVALLHTLGARAGAENVQVLVAWAGQEHGWDADPMADNNPLNTTLVGFGTLGPIAPGSAVQHYPTPADGYAATVMTLHNGLYPVVVQGLMTNNAALVFSPQGRAELATWGGDAAYPDHIQQVYDDLVPVPRQYYDVAAPSVLGSPPAPGTAAGAAWWQRLDAWIEAEIHGSADGSVHQLLVQAQQQASQLADQVHQLQQANATLQRRLALIAHLATE